MAVLKADAYGHGLVPTAQAAVAAGIDWLGVATVAEGAELREAGISAPIALLCTPTPQEVGEIVERGLTAVVGNAELSAALSRVRRSANIAVHLDIDTGMGRSGVLPDRAADLYERCLRDGLHVTGVCTHFADADGDDPKMTGQQWRRFDLARSLLQQAGARPRWVHAGNSAASLRFGAGGCNLIRPGLLLYGIRPIFATASKSAGTDDSVKASRLPQNWGSGGEPGLGQGVGLWGEAGPGVLLDRLKPVLSLKARIGAVRELPAGHTISYGATYRLTRPSRVATVLIGYGDGYPRRLSNRGEVLIQGRRAPIIGRVCMDQMVVDITDLPSMVAAGDECVCIGAAGTESITAESIAQTTQTTEHEITTSLTSRLPRIYRNTIPICC